MQVDDNEHYLMSKEELENKIATFTGGRAAEELIFHSVTTGASNDIEPVSYTHLFSLKYTGEDFYKISFFTRSRIAALSWFASVQKFLDIFF